MGRGCLDEGPRKQVDVPWGCVFIGIGGARNVITGYMESVARFAPEIKLRSDTQLIDEIRPIGARLYQKGVQIYADIWPHKSPLATIVSPTTPPLPLPASP